MFKGNTEVLTVLHNWVKIKDLRVGQLIWDGKTPVEITGINIRHFHSYCELYNHGEYSLTCGRFQRFIHEDVEFSTEAQCLNNHSPLEFIQEGVEKVPYISVVFRENSEKLKLYGLTLKDSNRYYVRVDEVTGLLVKC